MTKEQWTKAESSPAANGATAKRSPHVPTLRLWLTVFLLFFLVAPLCAASVWVYLHSRRYLSQAAVRNTRNVAALEALQVQLYVQRMQSVFASEVLRDARLTTLVLGHPTVDGQARRQLDDELATLRAELEERMPVEEVRILSAKGNVLASTSGADVPATDAASGRCASDASPTPRVAGFSYDRNGTTLLLARTIQGPDGDRRGILCVRSPLAFHRQLVLDQRARTTHASLFLLNERGAVISSSIKTSVDERRFTWIGPGRATTPYPPALRFYRRMRPSHRWGGVWWPRSR